MQSDYNKRDFEEIVRQSADQYRMFPSDKVWKGIETTLHTRRKWYGLGLAMLLFLTGAGVSWVMLSMPNRAKTLASTSAVEQSIAGTDTEPAGATPRVAVPPTNLNSPYIFSGNNLGRSSRQPHASFQEALINNQDNLTTGSDATTPPTGKMLEEASTMAVNLLEQPVREHGLLSQAVKTGGQPQTTIINPVTASSKNTHVNAATPGTTKTGITAPAIEISAAAGSSLPPTVAAATKSAPPFLESNSNQPDLSIESVVNAYQRPKPRQRVKLDVYISPMVTYRKLTENKAFLQSAASLGSVPSYAAYSDVKNYVTHKPDLGLELGVTARYALTKRLSVKAGAQFNVSRYGIRAFAATRERAVVVLDDVYGPSYQAETVYWTYKTSRPNGTRPAGNWLQNLYYSVSIPLGAEFMVTDRRKTNIGIAATLQPTYVIRDRAYLISTDYKNYVGAPSNMLRRINMNTGFEAFIAYKTRRSVIHIGPEVRYQVHSTFKDKYPVKENLFGFGLKVGVQLRK